MAIETTLREMDFLYRSCLVCFRKPFRNGYKDWWLVIEDRLDGEKYLCRVDVIGTVREDGLVVAAVSPYPKRRRIILPGYLPVSIPT